MILQLRNPTGQDLPAFFRDPLASKDGDRSRRAIPSLSQRVSRNVAMGDAGGGYLLPDGPPQVSCVGSSAMVPPKML